MKRILSAVLVLCILFSALSVPAKAADDPPITRASEYLSSYWGYLTPGDGAGEIILSFDVFSARTGITKIGVSQLRVYIGSTRVLTIEGTTANGLMAENQRSHNSSYVLHLKPGATYYAAITVTAGDANGSDSKNMTLNTVTAPAPPK